MRKILLGAMLPLSLILSSHGCHEHDEEMTIMCRRWVKVYNDVVLADDRYAAGAQFFNPKTGHAVKLEDAADSVRRQLALLCAVSANGDQVILTAPGSLRSTMVVDESRPYFTHSPNGLNRWDAARLNTSDVAPAAGGMTPAIFDQLAATATWASFNDAFRLNNGGNSSLSYHPNFQEAISDSCIVPEKGGVEIIDLSLAFLWDKYYTAAPVQLRQYGPLSSVVRKAYKA